MIAQRFAICYSLLHEFRDIKEGADMGEDDDGEGPAPEDDDDNEAEQNQIPFQYFLRHSKKKTTQVQVPCDIGTLVAVLVLCYMHLSYPSWYCCMNTGKTHVEPR